MTCRTDADGFCPEHGNDCVEVVYRDADNYKESTTLAFPGTLTEELRSRLRFALDSEQYYLPTQIQHEHLGTRMESWPDAQSDHVWHELDVDEIEQVNASEDAYVLQELSFEGFVQMMVENHHEGWDIVAACEELGLERGPDA